VKYAVVIEHAGGNHSAYVPDLPGCISVGDTIAETAHNIREAIALHVNGLQAAGEPIPPPTTHVGFVDMTLTA
jgi:predicted RNase H-like HicB family nuclease